MLALATISCNIKSCTAKYNIYFNEQEHTHTQMCVCVCVCVCICALESLIVLSRQKGLLLPFILRH